VKEETDKTHGKTMLLSRKRQENDKTMTRKWQNHDLTNDQKQQDEAHEPECSHVC
jgi:hypothetical protein